MKSDGTSDVRQSIGWLAPWAVQSAAIVFSTPGPGTTQNTPTLPVERA